MNHQMYKNRQPLPADTAPCSTCSAMMGTPEGLHSLLHGGYEHLTLQALRQSAEKTPCQACKAILRCISVEARNGKCEDESNIRIILEGGLESDFQPWLPTSTPAPGASKFQLEALAIKLHRVVMDQTGRQSSLEDGYKLVHAAPHFSVVTSELDCSGDYVPIRLTSKCLTPSLVSIILQKLDECFGNHKYCRRRLPSQLPRRVLDLGHKKSPLQSGRIRLYEPAEPVSAEYVALSYCWGMLQRLVTTKSNRRDHLDRGIPEDEIPKTISDAIEVCRKLLGIRYLWVDALCIVQDDEDDKAIEIGRMASIYQDATVTIIAASAQRVTDGFLDDHDESRYLPRLPIHISDSDDSAASAGSVYLRDYHAKLAPGSLTLDSEPLFCRAWAFQEYLLSPRALIFDAGQVSYRCGHRGSTPHTVLETHIDVRDEIDWLIKDGMSWDPIEWKFLVQEYSTRKLSYLNDRLPAIGAVATALAKSRGDTYLAGMWAQTITSMLCWSPRGDLGSIVDSKVSAQDFGAPSWSWASCAYPVEVLELTEDHVKLLDWEVELASASDSPYGPVRRASITLEGRVLDASDVIRGGGQFDYSAVVDLNHPESSPNWEECRMLYMGPAIFVEGYEDECPMFLVLTQVATETFERVGLFNGRRTADGKQNWDEIIEKGKRQVIILA